MTLNRRKTRYREAFVYAFGIATVIFLPFVLWENGYFFFYGDFNVQQIPFYQLAHNAVKTGATAWNWGTDLGVNFVGSYSFYLLGSPFFWLTTLFPSSWVIYMLAPLLVLKFAIASLTSYCYIQRHVRNCDFALLGALLYAFSGFSTYNIFYNHFHEVIAFFPLLLLSVDLLMEGKARGFFALAVTLNCLTNYFFFVGEVVFVAIYWTVRVLSGKYEVKLKYVLTIALEGVCGVLASAVLLLPALTALSGNSRSTDLYTGWGMLLYNNGQTFLYIIQSMFFMPELPARPVFFPDAGVQWSSVSAWLPLFGMTGVLSFCMSKRGHWIKKLLAVCVIMALVPVLNSAFVLFRNSYYARWFYMPLLIMALATASSFEDAQVDWRRGIKLSAIMTAGFALLIGFLPNSQGGGFWKEFGIYGRDFDVYPTRYWLYVLISASCLLLSYIFVKRIRADASFARRRALPVLLALIAATNIYFIAAGKSYSYDTDTYILPKVIHGAEDIELGDTGYYRIDVVNGMDNLGMYWGYESINCFHSIVPASVAEFYNSIGVERNVATRPEVKHYPLRALVSVEYVFVDNDAEFNSPGFTNLGMQNGFGVWRNDNFIPMGFSYDKYITESEYNGLKDDMDREQILLQAIVVRDADEETAKELYSHYEIPEKVFFEYGDFVEACRDRQASSCVSFERDSDGFTAVTENGGDELVFFSVPFDRGWSATVNGEAAEIYNVNVGFMAVRVPAGESTIQFTYTTPGLRTGALLTTVFLPVMIVYTASSAVVKCARRRGRAV